MRQPGDPEEEGDGAESATSFTQLPAGLPRPADDGAADHLVDVAMPDIALPATGGAMLSLRWLPPGRTVLYVYPRTGQPGRALPSDWDLIPGARGCTPEACAFRDHHEDLLVAGASVFGLSTQATGYQREVVERLHLPFPLLSDPGLSLAAAMGLPTFDADGLTFYRRLTLIVQDHTVEHVFYPVFPPDRHAGQVLRWLRDQS